MTETRRLADAVAAVRAIKAEGDVADPPVGFEDRLWVADDELYSVLSDIELGRYGASAEDMRAGLGLIADGSDFGWSASELGWMARTLLKGLPAA